MENQDYHTSFTTASSPEETFKKISNVSGWWSKHFEGKSEEPGDASTVRFGPNGEKDMYKIQVTEATPGKKIGWKVVDSKQDWVKNSSEWTSTEIIWDISSEKDGARITMTHKGLDPPLECFEECTGGWNYLTSESLLQLLQENVGKPV